MPAVTAPAMLYVTQCAPYRDGLAGVHGVLDQSAIAVREIASDAGLTVRRVHDVTELPVEELAAAPVIALFTIGETPWSAAQRAAILDNVRRGRTAIVAIHAATDSCHGWDEYCRLVGARFDGHPWTQEVELEVVAPDHPATRHLGATWRMHDEVYQFRDLRPDARILLRVPDDQLDLDAPDARRPAFGFPMSWCFSEGNGRVFSTTLGHFPTAWENPAYLQHVAGGLAWARGGA
jgi:type 1 glutamine amidotransferase